jgi:cobyrinic acid a,c-diamide synthase
MAPPLCRQLFERSARAAELAVIEGQFDTARLPGHLAQAGESAVGGRLETLCEWLDLPRVAIIDVRGLNDCRWPSRPDVEAVLLDGVTDKADYCRWRTLVESLWALPTLGALETLPAARAAIDRLSACSVLPGDLCNILGTAFEQYADWDALGRLAERRPLPTANTDNEEPNEPRPGRSPVIAVAYDEAFSCHFLDTYDALEARGATVVDFSPLHDETLPADVDLIYLGCGRPDRFAQQLSNNHCLRSALLMHLCSGRRIYAEGGGLAYLCQSLADPMGEQVSMVGALPAAVTFEWQTVPPEPVSIRLARSSWLADTNTVVRGYLNRNWQVEPVGPLKSLVAEDERPGDLWRHYEAIGSRVHLNFATQPAVLSRLMRMASSPVT